MLCTLIQIGVLLLSNWGFSFKEGVWSLENVHLFWAAVDSEAFITPLSDVFVVNGGHSTRGAGEDAVVARVYETAGGVTGRHVRYGDGWSLNEEGTLSHWDLPQMGWVLPIFILLATLGWILWNFSSRSGVCRCSAGSQEFSDMGYPFHLIRYCNWCCLPKHLEAKTALTSHSSSLSIRSGVGVKYPALYSTVCILWSHNMGKAIRCECVV